MIKMRYIFTLAAAVLLHAGLLAQGSLSPVLVGSSGDFRTVGNISLSSSVGEAVTITLGPVNNTYLTQGFQQPSANGIQALTVSFSSVNSTCSGASNGYGVAKVQSGRAPFTFSWSPAGGTSDTTEALPPGTYTVTVTDANGFSVTDSVVIAEENIKCDVVIYSGITPNGDGNNDLWVIDYIDLFPDNDVSIFNRWGERVWAAKGYNNVDVVWNGSNQSGAPLPDATYYYVVKVNGKNYSGWVELTH